MEPGQISQQDLYQDALAQANDELERMEDQLAARNRRLKARSRFFDALAAFQGELRPDAAPALALQAIAQTAVAALGTAPVAAFSAPAGQSVAQVILVSENGEVLLNCVRECPPRIARPPEGVGPVLGAGEEVEWLLEEVSPRLGGNQRFWICLEAERACIGGIVWGGRAGEAQRLSAQAAELAALACGWSLALRTAQIREESRVLAEQLAESNRQLHSAQAELLRGRTLVSVGEMAAGAAHEMNNPLAVISGRAQVLAGQLADPKLRHAAATIIEHAHRLSQIISDLMEFAKPQPPRLAAVDVADLVGRSVHEAKSQSDSADRNIEVTIAAVPPVLVDVKQLTAALVEVIDNAISATDAQQGRVLIHAAYDSHTMKVALSISDNGCGMDEETRKRAFDPFFSSKPAGRRRGLGLAKALRWIESSGGSIRLESRQGAGTRVLILMPAAYPMVSAGEAEPLASGQ
jgi:signal transduction histidine kinase